MSKISDQWRTPTELFKELEKEHGPFDIDLCATAENSKCERFCPDYLSTEVYQYLPKVTNFKGASSIHGELEHNISSLISSSAAFCNPPYSHPKPFIEKAWEDSKHCKIVLLVKCDPSTQWWATFWDYEEGFTCHRCDSLVVNGFSSWKCPECGTGGNTRLALRRTGPKPGCEVRFLPKRVQFDPPQQLIDSGEVWEVLTCTRREQTGTRPPYHPEDCSKCQGKGNKKWVQKCPNVDCEDGIDIENFHTKCGECKGKGYKPLSGPTFPSAVLVFDRRGLCGKM